MSEEQQPKNRSRKENIPIIGEVSDRKKSMLLRMPCFYKQTLRHIADKEKTTLNSVVIKALEKYFAQS